MDFTEYDQTGTAHFNPGFVCDWYGSKETALIADKLIPLVVGQLVFCCQ